MPRRITGFLLLLLAAPAWALINPKYTPVDLVKQSDSIARCELSSGRDGRLELRVTKAVKGEVKLPGNLSAAGEAVAGVGKLLAGGKSVPACVFLGDFSSAAIQADGRPEAYIGAIQVDGEWFMLRKEGEDGLAIDADPFNLKAVWAGSTPMLWRLADDAIADARTEVPVEAGLTWDPATSQAREVAAANGLLRVRFPGAGLDIVHVTSVKGDAAFQVTAEGVKEIPLAAGEKSELACWADIDADGEPELLSLSGGSLRVLKHKGEGLELIGKAEVPDAKSLSWTRYAGEGTIVLGTARGPVLFAGKAPFAKVASLEMPAGTGDAGRAVVADMDGDGRPDIVTTCPEGLVAWSRWQAADRPRGTLAYKGRIPTDARLALGDFDADGQLDLAASGGEGTVVLGNTGRFAFADISGGSGEIGYVAKPEVRSVRACDFNDDGRPDIALFYTAMGPQWFFSRGYACFGHALDMDVDTQKSPHARALAQGQIDALCHDLDGDGRQEWAVLDARGRLTVLRSSRKARGDRFALQINCDSNGTSPLTLRLSEGTRELGAMIVSTDGPVTVFRKGKGAVALRWQGADAREHTLSTMVVGPKSVTCRPQQNQP